MIQERGINGGKDEAPTLHVFQIPGCSLCWRLAFYQLGSIMVHVALEAGCRGSSLSCALKEPRSKPYFDRSRQELRAQHRYGLRHNVDRVRVLVLQFSSVIGCRCLQYQQQQTSIWLCHACKKSQDFKQKLIAHDVALPAAWPTHSAWAGFQQNLCALPAASIWPDRPRPRPIRGGGPFSPQSPWSMHMRPASPRQWLTKLFRVWNAHHQFGHTARLRLRQGGLLSYYGKQLTSFA